MRFGAQVIEDIFKECTFHGGSFRVSDIVDVLRPLIGFDFAQWSSRGGGSKGEIEAAKDFRVDFVRSLEKRRTGGADKQIKLR